MTANMKRDFEDLLAALKGKDVLITGSTTKGAKFTARRLNNVTATVRMVIGFDPAKGFVRAFRTELLTMIVLAPDQTEVKETRVA